MLSLAHGGLTRRWTRDTICKGEMKTAVKKLKKGKAERPSELTGEQVKQENRSGVLCDDLEKRKDPRGLKT